MALDFPASPTLGQTYTTGGVTWTFDGAKWVASGTGVGIYLPLTGGTMTGDLILNRDPVVALGAATKQSVDARGAGDNRIINGDMRIDQRNNGASGTATGVYTVDRWYFQASQAAKGQWQRGVPSSGVIASGLPYFLQFLSSSAFAVAASDVFSFRQPIEADMTSDFAFGTPNAQPVTLSFWVASSLTGTFSGALANLASSATRSYPFTFSIPVASTWTRIVITMPGDTAGTWALSGNGVGACLFFDLGTGTTFRGPANAWASANYIGVTGAVSVVGTNGAAFNLTGVKLEIGSVATPYNRQSLAKSMADCQRYFWTPPVVSAAQYASGFSDSATTFISNIQFPVMMRAAPSVVFSAASTFQVRCATANTVTGTAISAPTITALAAQINLTAASGLTAGQGGFLRDAGNSSIQFSAEL